MYYTLESRIMNTCEWEREGKICGKQFGDTKHPNNCRRFDCDQNGTKTIVSEMICRDHHVMYGGAESCEFCGVYDAATIVENGSNQLMACYKCAFDPSPNWTSTRGYFPKHGAIYHPTREQAEGLAYRRIIMRPSEPVLVPTNCCEFCGGSGFVIMTKNGDSKHVCFVCANNSMRKARCDGWI